jgi:hypothetical protein
MLSELSIKNPENQEWVHVRVSLEDEGGGAFLVLKQEDQEVRLDFEEIPLLVTAVEMLRFPVIPSSIATPSANDSSEWPLPNKSFLSTVKASALAQAINGDVQGVGCALDRAFKWKDSPQGCDYWADIYFGTVPFSDEHKGILQSWLDAIKNLRSQNNLSSIAQ